MKIDIICNDGSPLGVTAKSVWGEDGRYGVGGAELALITMCEQWTKMGHDVTLYNDPWEGGASSFPQKTLQEFRPEDNRDYLIVFRSPNERIIGATGKKIWWSCDQATVGEFRDFAKRVDKIVVISENHAKYFRDNYGIKDAITIDLPVRVDDYKDTPARISHRCIYTSIPDRGVMQLRAAWPLIVREVPDASLVITSDWRLWNPEIDRSCVLPYQISFSQLPNVSYVGAVNRRTLIQHQLTADLLLYPCTYDELFCIAVAEAQVSGAIPITSQFGAVRTTNEFGYQVSGSPYEPQFIEKFVEITVNLLTDGYIHDRRIDVMADARKRFSPDRIAKEWENKVFS